MPGELAGFTPARARSTMDHVPTPMMVDYYRRRAGAGLILSEATGISPRGLGWPYAPGIWNKAQIEAWKPITSAVHAAGGCIFSQLWHMGRLVHPSLPGRGQPVSASATTMPGLARTYDGKQPYTEARPMSHDDIGDVLRDYRAAARNALEASFDGVQIHAANGYLIDQFLRDNANFRTDESIRAGSQCGTGALHVLDDGAVVFVIAWDQHRRAVAIEARGQRLDRVVEAREMV